MKVEDVDLSLIKGFAFIFRTETQDEEFERLVESIQTHGVMQPILLRPTKPPYQIVAGRRRYEACKKLGLRTIPAVIEDLDDKAAFEVALSENIQRNQLTPFEEAKAFQNYLVNYRWGSITELAQRINKYHSYIVDRLKLLELPEEIQDQIVSGRQVSPSHAEEILKLREAEQMVEVAKAVEKEELTRDQTQEVVDLVVKEKIPVKKAVQTVKIVEYAKRKAGQVTEQLRDVLAKTEPEKLEGVSEFVTDELTTLAKRIEEIPERKIEPMKKPYLTLEEPLPVQYQNQRIWNLKQLIGRDLSIKGKNFHFDFITVGYSQKALEDFINSLKAAGVTLLIDIRKNPMSMYKPDFNRNVLEKDLPQMGIKYEHMPELGIPREIRDEAYEGMVTPQEVFEQYEKEVLTDGTLAKIDKVAGGHRTIAFLCTEVNPLMCHRHKIAEALTKMGKIGYDL